jgi:hypothetical protein
MFTVEPPPAEGTECEAAQARRSPLGMGLAARPAMSVTKNPWAAELLRLGRRTFGTVPDEGAALELAGCAPVDAPASAPAAVAAAVAPTLVANVGRAVARFQPRPPLERVGRAVREGVRDGGRLLLGPGAGALTPADCSLGE